MTLGRLRFAPLACAALVGTWVSPAARGEFDPAAFRDPPASARPLTWMHLMNGNVTAEGLTKDLESLARAGVGGAILFSVDYGIPAGDVAFGSDEFRALLAHAAREARRLGLTLGIHNSDGWSSSGGPWIEVQDSMKRVVWSEAVVRGGSPQTALLPQPPTRLGFYRDIATVAYPADEEPGPPADARPVVTASRATGTPGALLDGNLDRLLELGGDAPWLQLDYAAPFPARSLTLELHTRGATARLLASDDGRTFQPVTELAYHRTGKTAGVFTASFPPVRARHFRIAFSKPVTLCHLDLATTPRLPDWPALSGLARQTNDRLASLAAVWPRPTAATETPRVLPAVPQADGTLALDLPAGTWHVMRFGYTTTGATNYPATAAGRGLECDKFDRRALERHFAAYVDRVAADCGTLTGQSLQYVALDSYEMGGQNWTDDLARRFHARRGYDLLPYLPLLAGRCVGTPETAAAVLRDFRGFLADLMDENYHRVFTELCHRRGLISCVEPFGFGPFDHLRAGGAADVPVAEFWLNLAEGTNLEAAVSAAHTYGKPVVSAEAFTAWGEVNWRLHPALMKYAGDHAWAHGVNEFTFHRFAHQANTHVEPGMTMGDIGAHIDRTQTWWDSAAPAWTKYLQRGSYLLREGLPVADLLVYVGEASPQPLPTRADLALPAGYNYDLCDTEVLLHRLSVRDGRLVLPEGTSYRVLMLRNTAQLSLRLLHRLGELTAAGALVLGPPPVSPLGLREVESAQPDFAALVHALWTAPAAPIHPAATASAPLGAQLAALGVAPDLAVEPAGEISFTHRRSAATDLFFVVNDTPTATVLRGSFAVADRRPEIWDATTGETRVLGRFNRENNRTQLDLALPGHGSAFVVFRTPAEGIDPVRDVSSPALPAGTPAPRLTIADARHIELRTAAAGEHRLRYASGRQQTIRVDPLPAPLALRGPWQIAFPSAAGAPLPLTADHLSDWSESSRSEIRHFSGTADYTRTFVVPPGWLAAGRAVTLDLGRVEVCAELILNGRSLGVRWIAPFAFDVSAALRTGENSLVVRVTNLWTNRLIGDNALPRRDGYAPDQPMPRWYVENRPPPPGPRQTFTTVDFYEPDGALAPSGLLGPVTLSQEAVLSFDSKPAPR